MDDDLSMPKQQELSVYANLAERSALTPELICRARDGDKDAFSLLFMRTYQRMYFHVRNILSRDEDIYDALQIGYTKVFKYFPRLSDPEMFYPWLKKIMENAARDVYRQSRDILMDDLPEVGAADGTADIDRQTDIRRVLEGMDPRRAEVLTLYYYDGMKLSDIARFLNEPASTVRSRFKAAKQELLSLLQQNGIDSALYGGTPSAMIANCLRAIIGTDVLRAATAQQMLDEILGVKQHDLRGAAVKILEQQRSRSVRRAVTWLMALCAVVAILTTTLVMTLPRLGGVLPVTGNDVVSSTTTATTVGGITTTTTTIGGAATTTTDGGTTTTIGAATTTTDGGTTTTDGGATTTAPPVSDTFVPDYRPGMANTVGNSPNNVNTNRGFVAAQDEWLYYSAGNGYRYLYKAKLDGSEHQFVAEETAGFSYLNVVGDWIYYCSNAVFRMRTDGTTRELLSPINASRLYVEGQTAYFSDFEGTCVYVMDLTTRKVETLLSSTANGIFAVRGDMLLYVQSGKLTAQSLTTGEKRVLAQTYAPILFDGDTMYFANDSVNYRAAEPVVQSTGYALKCSSGGFYSPYNGGYIGSLDNSGLVVKDLSGNTVWHHTEIEYYLGVYTIDDTYIYFYKTNAQLCRAKPDGTDMMTFG